MFADFDKQQKIAQPVISSMLDTLYYVSYKLKHDIVQFVHRTCENIGYLRKPNHTHHRSLLINTANNDYRVYLDPSK